MNELRFFQVDAFAGAPFKGNQAAVCILQEELPAAVMQAIAAENNIAETAFVRNTGNGFDLRWFTPAVEVDLCGHATLASAHILWQEGLLGEEETALFHTRSGLLKAVKKGDWVEIDLPAAPGAPAAADEALLNALQVRPVQVVFAKDRYVIEVATARELMALQPDPAALKGHGIVVVTSLADKGSAYDFLSRTFCPDYGIDEDPVTGSSHCALVPYYAAKLHRQQFFAYQASARGGELKLELAGSRVLISGQAFTVISGSFRLQA